MRAPKIILCNSPPKKEYPTKPLRLTYLGDPDERNVKLGLPPFVKNVFHLPARILDLLEIAAYVYAADRLVKRSEKTAVEYQSWARWFQFHISVRDIEFWSNPQVTESLCKALEWMSGDRKYEFRFYPGHSTPPSNLFDRRPFNIGTPANGAIVLPFSGGLDSLAGALAVLSTTDKNAILVSHQPQPGVKRTQNALVKALTRRFPDRVFHYGFECHLDGTPAREETQRTRSFLYSCIAFAIAHAYNAASFNIYENGVTSLNFARRQDLMNARASRTTHPQTIGRMQEFLSLVSGASFRIHLPFLWMTKTDVIRSLLESPSPELMASAVSCGHTRRNKGNATHCGECFQCIDRRMAAYAAGATEDDHVGLYTNDILSEPFSSREARTSCVDYIRQAKHFAKIGIDEFYEDFLSELVEVVEWLPSKDNEMDSVERVWRLCLAHGQAVREGLRKVLENDDPFVPLKTGSLMQLVTTREHLKPEVTRLVESILRIIRPALPMMFRLNPPKHEADLNEKIRALISSRHPDIQSEHPTVSYACARVVPDHTWMEANLLIEAKYIRKGTPPSKASEGIAADQTKYPQDAFILFLVLDLDRAIPDDARFINDIESRGRCKVCILR